MMELSEIISNYTAQYFSQNSLTEEQKATLEAILNKYDPEDSSEEERQALRAELHEAGIPRTAETGRILMEAGFGPRLPEGKQAGGPSLGPLLSADEVDNTLLDLITKMKSGKIDRDEFMSLIMEYIESEGSISTGKVIDRSV